MKRKRVKRFSLTALALLLTGALALLYPRPADPGRTPKGVVPLRVWVAEDTLGVLSWLRGQARAYEKATGSRVYLRLATREEAALTDPNSLTPDVLVAPGQGQPLCGMRHVLAVRDAQAALVTPAPTRALFYPPTVPPDYRATPAPTPDLSIAGPVLVPHGVVWRGEGGVYSPDPAAALTAGRASAAVITVREAKALSVPCRFYPASVQSGLWYGAAALKESGEAFVEWLLSAPAKAALADAGLFDPGRRLYAGSGVAAAAEEGVWELVTPPPL